LYPMRIMSSAPTNTEARYVLGGQWLNGGGGWKVDLRFGRIP
jgi:hypothetical protein